MFAAHGMHSNICARYEQATLSCVVLTRINRDVLTYETYLQSYNMSCRSMFVFIALQCVFVEKRYSLYYPTVVRPKSLENITDAINFARMFNKQVTIIGSGHSWSDIAQPNNDKAEGSKKYNGSVALCMRCYSGVVGVNKRKKEVTVLGGTTLARLRDILHDNNLALEVFPSINEQTIAGAIATGMWHEENGHQGGTLQSMAEDLYWSNWFGEN